MISIDAVLRRLRRACSRSIVDDADCSWGVRTIKLVIAAVMRDASRIPVTDAKAMASRPPWVDGTRSPYPTVVIVTNVSHIEFQTKRSFVFSNVLPYMIHLPAPRASDANT